MSASQRDRLTLSVSDGDREDSARLVSGLSGSGDEPLSVSAGQVSIEVPASVGHLMSDILRALADGKDVVVANRPERVTTTVAAEMLGISRPTLMKLVRSGELESHLVGTHTRLMTRDVLRFQRERLERQRVAFDELRRLEDELGI